MSQKQSLFVAPPLHKDEKPSIGRILIANRGEIACRVIHTCRQLGIVSIAVYTDADARSPFVRLADHAIFLGAADQQPYLDIELLIKTAQQAHADAIHPGYGYLSENAEFARAVAVAGIKFIGPSPESIAALGDKREAKIYLAAKSKVPLVPGYNGLGNDPSQLEEEADKIGYPVIIKASAGGGGKGMRIVHNKASFQESLQQCTSEAERLFGSAHCLIEKYIKSGKHIEIQVFGDGESSISLLDRECSVQRRNQKVIEESPCAWLSDSMRKDMSRSALEIADLLKYESAGTVEFIVDVRARKYYFLEVNTRIQVEHPITEEVVGVDIVALQIFVASGGRLKSLPRLQNIAQVGHAIEVRLCAEDPFHDFRPCIGTVRLFESALETLNTNRNDNAIRYELGAETGSNVTIHFDSLISKLIVWAPNRSQALQKMSQALAHTICLGLTTNQVFLQRILASPAFQRLDYSTALIPDNFEELLAPVHAERQNNESIIIAQIAHKLLHKHLTSGQNLAFRSIPASFRNQRKDRNLSAANIVIRDLASLGSDRQEDVFITETGIGMYKLVYFNQDVESLAAEKEQYLNKTGGLLVKRYYSALASNEKVRVERVTTMESRVNHLNSTSTGQVKVSFDGLLSTFAFVARREDDYKTRVFLTRLGTGIVESLTTSSVLAWSGKLDEGASSASRRSTRVSICPMPSKILRILVEDGANAKVGDGLLILESMKTEIRLTSAADGKVSMKVKVGNVYPEGTVLCEILEPVG